MNVEFNDSTEATEFLDALDKMLNDPRLVDWVKQTDENYGTSASAKLKNAHIMIEEIFNADCADWDDE